jgi:hypothetical protein
MTPGQRHAILTARRQLLAARARDEDPAITVGRLDTILTVLLRDFGEEDLPLRDEEDES